MTTCGWRVRMDALSDNDLALMKFGVGQPVPRKEDPTLLLGEGRYTDDINLAGQAYAVPGNLALDFDYGDADAVKKALAEAAHVTRLEIVSNRIVVNPMEPRSAIGAYENDRWVLRVGCQGVMGLRGGLARDVLNVPTDKVRVLTGNVGGSFGMKSQVYPEYRPVLLAARTLGRPVKWTDERSESFLSDHAGRDHQRVAELALDKDGRFLGVRLSGTGNAGAYIYPPMPATTNAVKNVIDVYRTPAMEVNSKVVFTNTTPVGPYRRAGRPPRTS